MAKINVETDCGNAPRKLFLSKFTAAIGNCDREFINIHIAESIIWENTWLGNVCEKESYLNSLEKSPMWDAMELNIESIITHGSEAAVSGRIIHSQKKQYLFCDLYKFTSAGSSQIKNIRSFSVPV